MCSFVSLRADNINLFGIKQFFCKNNGLLLSSLEFTSRLFNAFQPIATQVRPGDVDTKHVPIATVQHGLCTLWASGDTKMTATKTLTASLLTAWLLTGCHAIPLELVSQNNKAAPAVAAAAAPAASMITPLIEKRETLVATGYAVVSIQNHKNPAQQRLLAIRASKLDAYRSLTEQVYGQQLDATTTVADMTIMSDTFRAKVEGVVYGAVLVSITPVGDDTYETTLSLDQHVVRDLRTLYLGQMAAKRR
jgi:hypothetical protein